MDQIDGRGIVTLDSPAAQANRLEPLFMRQPLADLVPQIAITTGNKKKNLLELGHRAADALVCSVPDSARTTEEAFEEVLSWQPQSLADFRANDAGVRRVGQPWHRRQTPSPVGGAD